MEPTKEQIEQEAVISEERTSEYLRASQQVRETRLNACSTCPSKTTMFGLDACQECGCVIKLRVFLTAAECPKGKW